MYIYIHRHFRQGCNPYPSLNLARPLFDRRYSRLEDLLFLAKGWKQGNQGFADLSLNQDFNEQLSWKPDGRQKRKEEEDTSFETEETLDETSSCLAVEKENVRASQVDTGRFHDNGVWIVHEMRFNPNILGRYLGYRKWLKLLFLQRS